MLKLDTKKLLLNQIWNPRKYDWHYSSPEDTILLVNFDGTFEDQSNYKCDVDNSATEYKENDKVYSFINYSEHKFGNGSVLDYTYYYVSRRQYNISKSNWNFGDSDFTVDFWTKRNGNKWYKDYSYKPFDISKPNSSSQSAFGLYVIDNQEKLGFSGNRKFYNTNLDFGTLPNDNEWHHIAIVYYKDKNQVKVAIDGKFSKNIAQCNDDFISTINKNQIWVAGNASYNWPHYLDEFRVSKKVVWTKDFVPPESAYEIN